MSVLTYVQCLVSDWCADLFGEDVAKNTVERSARLVEEAVEVAQALKLPKDVAHRIVDHVYSRPVGDVPQEVAGVFLTILSLSTAAGVDLTDAFHKEWHRINDENVKKKILANNAIKHAAGLSMGVKEESV